MNCQNTARKCGQRTASGGDHSPDAMMHAYRALAKGAEYAAGEREKLMSVLLKGTNAAWAWFALRNLRTLTELERTELIRIVLKVGDGEITVWCLEEHGLTDAQRNMLKSAILSTKLGSLAHMALDRVSDLTTAQRSRLEKIASGMDPDA